MQFAKNMLFFLLATQTRNFGNCIRVTNPPTVKSPFCTDRGLFQIIPIGIPRAGDRNCYRYWEHLYHLAIRIESNNALCPLKFLEYGPGNEVRFPLYPRSYKSEFLLASVRCGQTENEANINMNGHICEACDKSFTRRYDLERHHVSCQRKRGAAPSVPIQVKKMKLSTPPASPNFNVRMIHRGMGDLFKIYRAQFKRVWKDVLSLTTLLAAHILYLIDRAVMDTNGIKAQLRCTVTFTKDDAKGDAPATKATWHFNSRQHIYLHTTNSSMEYAKAMTDIHRQIEEFTQRGSGWVVQTVDFLDLYISKYTPIRGHTYCKVPKELMNTKAIVNVRNNDNKCFMWSVLAKIRHDEEKTIKNSERVSCYQQLESRLNLEGFNFPMALTDIPRFEEANNLAINVLGYDKSLYRLYTTNNRDIKPINLLLLTPDDGPAHYCWIKNLNKLLFQSTKYEGQKFICDYCLCPFNTPQRLEKHSEFCTSGHQRIEMPRDTTLKFKNVYKQIRAPYVMYADFECSVKADGEGKQHHVPNSYGLLGVRQCCADPVHEEPKVYRGEDPVKNFLNTIIDKGEAFQREKVVPMGKVDSTSDACHICKETLTDAVRDHCHQCGRFRGMAHATCNTKLYEKKDVTVFFHNLRRYDGHLIMQEMGAIAKERGLKLECVPRGAEDYISFTIRLKTDGKMWSLRFVDSLAFLNASLETLTSNLPNSQLTSLRKFTKHPDLLLRKGVYPYEFMDGPEKFNLTSLPPPDAFYNKLKLEPISTQDYNHAQKVWETHNMENMGEYHDLYLLTDVLLLADVFQGFRDFSMQHYGLDPAHYITLPSLAWDALLKTTGVKLELLEDPNMYQFFSAGIRGGISSITHRRARANHPLLPGYNPSKPKSYIMYWDANNLYGWAMQRALPVGGFEWVGPLSTLPSKEEGVGYIWEVDLDYPETLHPKHNIYPMAPEKIPVPIISPYCQTLKEKLNLPNLETEKLIPNLMNKRNYIVHDDNLRLYMEQGLKLKKIHRGIKFQEAPWMTPYIDFNTEMRKKATSAFQKDLFKLLNNAVFGKSMENVFNYTDVRLVTESKKYEKLVASPLYKESQPFNNDLTAVVMNREKAVLNKPIYTGFSVLELSKTLMYRFHYEYIIPRYGSQATLLFTDTDSLCYHIETENIINDMMGDRDEWFDTSGYPLDHPLYSEKNKKVIGMMKDEKDGQMIEEFVGLRAKMYSIRCGGEDHKRAKGISRAVVRHRINHDDYNTALDEEACLRHEMTIFRSNQHEIYTVNINKSSLSAYDDKRYILEDGITTLAYGHVDIPKEKL